MLSGKQTPAVDLSPFLSQLVTRHPDWMEELKSSGRLEKDIPPNEKQLATSMESAGLNAALRQFRNQEMMRLIWRDLNGLARVDEILADLSALAEVCLQTAVNHHSGLLEDKHGIPRNAEGEVQKLVVIGLGKLGGYELNLSSDIDIVFCYPQQGVCDGPRGLAGEQFFTRLARNVIRSLSEVTVDGFCFRVDTRLRPFGESGPLVSSFSALEQYYQREGRDWERYALIKARPVAGDLGAGQMLLDILKPFVYRRYIDFGAIEALRDMHANVREDTFSKNRLDDIKRGPGGIREIEFLVQSFQLLRGGRERILQTPSIVKAAGALRELHLLPTETVNSLLDAYRFLRMVENRIQALHDQQTHIVPGGEDGLRVALAMGYETIAQFQVALENTRDEVQALFENSLPQAVREIDERNPWHTRWQQLRNDKSRLELEFRNQKKPLLDFAGRLSRLSLSQRASRRLDQFMPLLLQRIDELSLMDEVVYRVLDLVSAICQRSAYLSLLVQNPQATERMLELFTLSQRVARTVTRHPALLDELIDPSLGARPPGENDIMAGLKQIMAGGMDTETTLQELNYFKQVIALRIAVAVLQSTMDAPDAMRTLGQLAGALVQAVLNLACADMESRHGELAGPGLAVIAYGSLGAGALGFDSDLDLIFLYQPTSKASDGQRPIPAERYHTGVARRMLSLLSASTPAGRLYSIDARLRPNGRAGLLVSSLDAFARYQVEEAWVWELQALTRARPIAGNADIANRFIEIRRSVLIESRDENRIRKEIPAMRQRIQDEHGGADPLKHAPGGLVDIEFIAQLGLLLNAARYPALTEPVQIDEQLSGLWDCGWLDNNEAQTLLDALEQLLDGRLRSALLDQKPAQDQPSPLNIALTLCDDILR